MKPFTGILKSVAFLATLSTLLVFTWTAAQAQPPLIEGMFPSSGHQGQAGILATISGDFFDDGATVVFGTGSQGIDAVDVNYINSQTLEVTIDIQNWAVPDFYTVFVINPDYEQGALVDGFEVLLPEPPEPMEVIPNYAYTGDTGLAVSILGNLLYTVTGVDFGSGITVDPGISVTNTRIDCTINVDWLAVPGMRDVTVYSPVGDAVITDGFQIYKYEPPQVASIDVTEACQGDSDITIVVTGSEFIDPVEVGFLPAGITVNSVIFDNPGQLTINIDVEPSATIGSYDLVVTNPDNQEGVLPGAFTVLDCGPKIDYINPTQGYQGDLALPVTISGSDFGTVNNVSFGAGITVNVLGYTDTQISVELDILPTATPGFRTVTVWNDYGSGELVDAFEVLEIITYPPVITSVFPDTGVQGAIGLPVEITGENLETVEAVSFGEGITVSVISQTMDTIEVYLDIDPYATIGFRNVTVSNPDGDDILPNGFEVLGAPPVIDTVLPSQGERGTISLPVTISGDYLEEVSFVDFGSGIDVTIGTATMTSVDVTIDISESAALGPRDVTVTTPYGDATLPNGFEVVLGPPQLTNVVPGQGAQNETLDLVITGTNFDDVTQVDFGAGITVDSYVIISSTEVDVTITIALTAALGTRDVTVSDSQMRSDTLIDGFEVTAAPVEPPEILALDPDSGYQGTTNLQIGVSGQHFQDGITIDFGHPGIIVNSTNFINDSFFEVFVDIDQSATVGPTDVVVTNPDEGEDILVDGFTVLEGLFLEAVVPDYATQGETIDIQIIGAGIDPGATVEFFPNMGYFDLMTTVVNSSLIEGTLSIDPMTPPGYYSIRVTNPDMREAVLTDAFQVQELIIPPPQVESIIPMQFCIGAVGESATIYGAYFQDGVEVTFESDAFFDVFTTFIDEGTIEVTFSVSETAVEGLYDVLVTNPDGQNAYAPQVSLIDCGLEGNLQWVDSFFDVFIDFTGQVGDSAIGTGSADLENMGDGDYENVILSMTDLVSPGGLGITPEMVEIYPSIVGFMPAQGMEQISVDFTIPVGEELMTAGGDVFMGSLIAQDTVTGDRAVLPVTVTIVTPGAQFVEVDPMCLQVDLFTPGAPADLAPGVFNVQPGEFPDDVTSALGGCESPFPMFQWASYAMSCPGYMETWNPSFTLSVYPIYPGQSAEEAVVNRPIWREENITETFIQYPLTAEPLAGFYVWQIEALPVPVPGLAIGLEPSVPIVSEIWAFCVEGEIIGLPPEGPPIPGDLRWFPESRVIDGCGMVPATLVLSEEAVSAIGSDTECTVIFTTTMPEPLVVQLNLAGIQFSDWNPMPDYGPAAIDFGINVTPVGNIGEGMGPEDLKVQIYNGGVLLGEVQLGNRSDGHLELGAAIGGLTAVCDLTIIWPWQNHCWDAWIEWWRLKQELQADCVNENDALETAQENLDNANEAFEQAMEAVWEAVADLAEANETKADAQEAYDDAVEACGDFFSGHIFSNYISFSDPGPGWSYVEAFGGAVGIWFLGNQGAELLNAFIDQYRDEYGELYDNLRNARDALEEAESAAADAEDAFDEAMDAAEEAMDNLQTAQEAYNEALSTLNACLDRMNEIRERIAAIEWQYPECFRHSSSGETSSGLGIPGQEGGPQLPPIDEGPSGEGGGEEGTGPGAAPGEGPGTGIGTGTGGCDCEDCRDAWQAVQDAEDRLQDAEDHLSELEADLAEAQQALEEALAERDEAQEAWNEARDALDEAQEKLDSFMETHVFSGQVGGTPEYGPNRVRYKGVDIYFSDYNVFMNIFELIKPWIDELAEQLDQAQAEFDAADEALLAAEMKVFNLQEHIDMLNNQIAIARHEVNMANVNLINAQIAYNDCVDSSSACREANGCPPWTPPHEQEGGAPGQPGEEIPWMPGEEETDGGPAEEPGPEILPPGQGTGTGIDTGGGYGEGGCDCLGCELEYAVWVLALRNLDDARERLAETQDAIEEATRNLTQAEAELEEAQAAVDYLQSLLETTNPFGDEYKEIQAELEAAESHLVSANIHHMLAQDMLEILQNTLGYIQGSVEACEHLREYAFRDLNDCMQRLIACEHERGCPPSGAPGEGWEGGYEIPWPEDGIIPGAGGGEGGEIGDERGGEVGGEQGGEIGGGGEDVEGAEGEGEAGGQRDEGEGQVGECPCKDCSDELIDLRNAERALEAAEDAFLDAIDKWIDAKRAYDAAKAAEDAAQAEVDAAQKAVDDLQQQLDKAKAQIDAMDGLSTNPAGGRSSGSIGGVRIYFNDPAKFSRAMAALRQVIGNVGRQLAQAQERLRNAQRALEDAQFNTQRAQTAFTLADIAANNAWHAYESAYSAFNQAYNDYMDCIVDRLLCLLDHPEECEGEELEPGGGYTGRTGTTRGKDCGCKQALDEFDTDGLMRMPDWAEWQAGISDDIQGDLDDVEAALEPAQARASQAQSEVDAALAELSGAMDDFGQFFEEYMDFVDTMDDLLTDLPEGAFILDQDVEPPDGFEKVSLDGLFLYYPSSAGAEIPGWLNSHRDSINSLSELSTGQASQFLALYKGGGQDISSNPPSGNVMDASARVAEAVDRLAAAYDELYAAEGELAELQSRQDSLQSMLDDWSEKSGAWLDEIGPLDDEFQSMIDQIHDAQDQAAETGPG